MTPEQFQTKITESLALHSRTEQVGGNPTQPADYQAALCRGRNTQGDYETLLYIADVQPNSQAFDGVVISRDIIETGETEFTITNPGFTKDAFKHLGTISVAWLK